ncbi:hypothetical protein Abu_1325 [Aliarcobacter butzleri RM4018]|uniref:Uncharacterized protein n=1 Tax=Aliarcobacter butzleri (strain RM4018) TaxID=367737 RepID=A8EUF7_ALIB4|nr:hypothetical protein [Aliarcobacter butzleri]ABV67581.1 hypothetical protein Abu_1325 [Aliarcobacter butzleri RM4018]GGT74681.1 hypothetical protein GCM10007985_08230 [Aliarcobacter butzleri]SNV29391.1 Uncharacterised protein [Aliarcobacter butzleri]
MTKEILTRFHINEKYGDIAIDLLDDYTSTYEAYGYYTYDDFKTFAKYIDFMGFVYRNNWLLRVVNIIELH